VPATLELTLEEMPALALEEMPALTLERMPALTLEEMPAEALAGLQNQMLNDDIHGGQVRASRLTHPPWTFATEAT
jgi:hypothetical protein